MQWLIECDLVLDSTNGYFPFVANFTNQFTVGNSNGRDSADTGFFLRVAGTPPKLVILAAKVNPIRETNIRKLIPIWSPA